MTNGPVAIPAIPSDTKALGDPAVVESIRRSVRRSVVETEVAGTTPSTTGGDISSVFFIGTQADGMSPWGVNPTFRDRQLRLFYPTEAILQSSISSMIARNMGFSWVLKGPKELQDATFDLLHSANRGAGWLNFVGKVSTDLYTQDKGAFVEIIRQQDRPDSPVLGIQSLDASRCFHTGDPNTPVLYIDRKGKWHKLRWYQVFTLVEMPAPHELLFGLQYCAMTRIMRAAQIYKNIQTYRDEKTGGRFARALHVLGGVEASRITDVLADFDTKNDDRGLTRYPGGAPIITALNPANPPSLVTLELATLPDNFDAEQAFKEYLTIVALGLFVDFQEIAPLPGGGLGSGSQSEILHLKTAGKGPALFMKLIEQKLNAHVLPRPVTFEFDEVDIEAQKTEAEVAKTRAEAREIMVASGEIDSEAARQLALDAGDIPQELFDAMGGRDLTAPVRRGTDRTRREEEGRDNPSESDERVEGDEMKALATRLLRGTKQETDTTIRDFLVSRLHRAFTVAADDMRGLGVMDTGERIQVSGIVGDVLTAAEDILDEGGREIMRRNLEAEDQRVLVTASKERDPDRAGPEQERLDLESEVADTVGEGLGMMRANVRRRLDDLGLAE